MSHDWFHKDHILYVLCWCHDCVLFKLDVLYTFCIIIVQAHIHVCYTAWVGHTHTLFHMHTHTHSSPPPHTYTLSYWSHCTHARAHAPHTPSHPCARYLKINLQATNFIIHITCHLFSHLESINGCPEQQGYLHKDASNEPNYVVHVITVQLKIFTWQKCCPTQLPLHCENILNFHPCSKGHHRFYIIINTGQIKFVGRPWEQRVKNAKTFSRWNSLAIWQIHFGINKGSSCLTELFIKRCTPLQKCTSLHVLGETTPTLPLPFSGNYCQWFQTMKN